VSAVSKSGAIEAGAGKAPSGGIDSDGRGDDEEEELINTAGNWMLRRLRKFVSQL
jgi:hypothetical protein